MSIDASSHTKRLMPAIVIGGWTIAALLYASHLHLFHELHEDPTRWRLDIADALITCWTWAALTFVVMALVRAVPFRRGALVRPFALHLLFSIVIALAQIVARSVLHDLLVDQHASFAGLVRSLLARAMFFNVLTYWAIVVVRLAVTRDAARQRQAAELETRLVEARLEALQSQMQPHFLFNTLHTIASLIREDAATAERMVLALSDLLRTILERSTVAAVTLEEELAVLRTYLEIQRVRFQDRLTISLDCTPEALRAAVPSLLLQPLVENSIRHGIESRRGAGHIAVSAVRQGSDLLLRVSDDGPGLAPQIVEGVGLGNTRERLRQLYGDAHELTMRSTAHGADVELRIPFATVRP